MVHLKGSKLSWIEIFNPGVPEVSEVVEVKQPWNSNQWKFFNENLWKYDEIQNLARATSKMSSTTLEGTQWVFLKVTFLKSVHQAEENEILLGFLVQTGAGTSNAKSCDPEFRIFVWDQKIRN